jgi:hypothetical protein
VKPPPPPSTVCGNGVCETGETITTCPADCGASLTIVNETAWVIADVFIWPCGSSTIGANQIHANIAVGASSTVDGIPPGCYNQGAANVGGTELWETDSQTLSAGPWTWTLTTGAAIAN